MALSTCRECKEPVSTGADKCPKCGVQYPTAESGARSFWTVAAAISVGVAIFFYLTQ